MNRELQFTIWDKSRKCFLGWADFCDIGTEEDGIFDLNKQIENQSYNFGYKTEDNFVIQQFTGLKDKNGFKIFEGDIIELCHEFKELGIGTVVNPDGSRFLLQIKSENPYRLLADFCNEDFCGEIIGNIFETPELLKS